MTYAIGDRVRVTNFGGYSTEHKGSVVGQIGFVVAVGVQFVTVSLPDMPSRDGWTFLPIEIEHYPAIRPITLCCDYCAGNHREADCSESSPPVTPGAVHLDDPDAQPSRSGLLLRAAEQTVEQVTAAMAKWPAWPTAHHGFATLHEEFDELKAHVWMRQKNRNIAEMRAEAIDVAACALRFVVDICDGGRARA